MNEQYDGKVEQKLLISAKVKTRANLDARRLLIYQAVYVVPQYMLDKPQLRVYVCVYWPGAMDISPWETEKMCGWHSLQISALAHTHKMHFITTEPRQRAI